MSIAGHIDRLDRERIEGWIVDRNDPSRRIALDVCAGERVVAQVVADGFRQDLADAKLGDGNCAFSFQPPAFLSSSELNSLTFRLAGGDLVLPLPPAADKNAKAGGLWIDRADWIDVLGRKLRAKVISEELAGQIVRFVRDGYVVIPGAVDAKTLAKLNADIDSVWTNPPKGLLIETFEPDGVMKYITPSPEYRAGRTKLLDIYTSSDIARQAIAAPAGMAFLSAIFEDKPKAFQSLTFYKGSQQAIHKDTAYVKVDSNPTALAATWLALEDISPGTGELEYFVGSHHSPPYLFGGVSRWMEGNEGEHDAFLKSLVADAERLQQPKSSFLAKAGDLLIWHADLAHGGSPITNAQKTRKSLVTHFCPISDVPFYAKEKAPAGVHGYGCAFISQYSDL